MHAVEPADGFVLKFELMLSHYRTPRQRAFNFLQFVMVIRKVLRRIYGPTKENDGTWRIKSNEELNRLTGNKNTINYIKAQRLAWFKHVHRMPDNSMVKKVYRWSPALTRSLGRSKNKWEDDVKSDITRMKIANWKDCIRNRIKWKKLVEKAKTSLKL